MTYPWDPESFTVGALFGVLAVAILLTFAPPAYAVTGAALAIAVSGGPDVADAVRARGGMFEERESE